MRTLNRVFLLGCLGRDAETKFTQGGAAKTTFSLATTRRWKDGEEWKEETDWHNCVLWRQESVAAYLLKGKAVHVEGRLHTRSWEQDGGKRYATDVIVEQLILMGGGGESELVSRPRSSRAPAQPAQDPMEVTDADLPF